MNEKNKGINNEFGEIIEPITKEQAIDFINQIFDMPNFRYVRKIDIRAGFQPEKNIMGEGTFNIGK